MKYVFVRAWLASFAHIFTRSWLLRSPLNLIADDTVMLMTRYSGGFGRWKNPANLLVAAGCFAIAACGSLPSISTDVTYCCRPAAEVVHSFRVAFEDMPEFLKPMLRDEASIVLDSKGLDYTEGDADAVLTMTYIDTPISPDNTGQDGAQFRAEVQVELKNSVTGELISSGSVSRVHNVTVGAYMHEAPARDAMRKAFVELFSDYPDPIVDEI